MDLKGTRTEANLAEAFAGESQARNKYTYYASIARKAGYEHIAAIFLETAENEREHAKLILRAMGGLEGDTAANLLAAAGGENGEVTRSSRYSCSIAKPRPSMRPMIAASTRLVTFRGATCWATLAGWTTSTGS
jgi:rubrerythrin